MCRDKPSCPELLNTLNMFLHPLIDERDRPPLFIGHGHQRPTLDRALSMKLDVEPFSLISLLGGLDQEHYIVASLP